MKSVQSFFTDLIVGRESSKLSLVKADAGNWYRNELVGSRWGITAAVLAKHRNVKYISREDVKNLSLEEAVCIGVELFYDKPDFDLLGWDPVVASVVDMGFNAGPGRAVKLLQKMVGANEDGQIGGYTVSEYRSYKAEFGLEEVARHWSLSRHAFYDLLVRKRPSQAIFAKGWSVRVDSFLPKTTWWTNFCKEEDHGRI